MENVSLRTDTGNPLFNFTKTDVFAALPNEPIITIVSQSILGIIGFFANLSVIITLSSTKKLRNKFINIYIINQVRSCQYVI